MKKRESAYLRKNCRMVVFPCAKINIGLRVLNKRSDGYHNLQSIFYPTGLCDVLELQKSTVFSYQQTGLAIAGEPANNLVIKAWQLVNEKYQVGPVAIFLHKVIPMGAGLGGGSADASFALKALNELFGLRLDHAQLRELALQLGSDCPFFIESAPALVSGRGEIIEKIPVHLGKYWVKILFTGLHVSTKEAFAGIEPENQPVDYHPIDYDNFETNLNRFKNDFEVSVFKKHPILAASKESLLQEGAIYASMTGSGSAVYGIFNAEPPKTGSTKFEYTGPLSL